MSIRPAAVAAAGCGAADTTRSDTAAPPQAAVTAARNVRRSIAWMLLIASPARSIAVFEDHLVEAVAELVGDVDGLVVRARDRVNRVEPPGQPSELAEGAEHLAGEIHLVDLADAADEDHLVRSGGDAQRPGEAVEIPRLLERAVGVEHLNPVVLAIGDVEVLVAIDDDAVRGVELAGPRAAVAPVLHQVALARELGDARVAVAVGDEGAPVGRDDGVGGLVEARRRRNRPLDAVRHVDPRLEAPAERLDDPSPGVELDDDVVAGVDEPHVVLGVEADAVRGVENRRAVADRAGERAVGVELEQRMFAAVEQEDVPL